MNFRIDGFDVKMSLNNDAFVFYDDISMGSRYFIQVKDLEDLDITIPKHILEEVKVFELYKEL